MRAKILIFNFVLIIFTMPVSSAQIVQLQFKYKVGDCITPINPIWSWFSKIGKIEDIYYGEAFKAYVYSIYIPKSAISKRGSYDVYQIENNTAKVTSCPF